MRIQRNCQQTNSKCREKRKFSILWLDFANCSFEHRVSLFFSSFIGIYNSMHRAHSIKTESRNQSDFGFFFNYFSFGSHSAAPNSPGQAFASKNIEIITRQANRTESQQAISHEYSSFFSLSRLFVSRSVCRYELHSHPSIYTGANTHTYTLWTMMCDLLGPTKKSFEHRTKWNEIVCMKWSHNTHGRIALGNY